VEQKKINKVNSLLHNIQGIVTDSEWDEILLNIINLCSNTLGDRTLAETYVPKIRMPTNEIQGLIACRKLKIAYVKAVKLGAKNYVRLIRDEARRLGMQTEVDICEKYLKG
jgi:hypothetical protein